MRKRNYLKLTSLILLFSVSACNQDIDDFDVQESKFVYFDMPYLVDDYGRIINQRDTVMKYSFDLDEISVKSHTFKIPINIAGMPTTEDREYKVETVAAKTTATDADWDKNTISNLTIKGGAVRDTIYLKVNRTEILKTVERVIALRIVPNDNFAIGYHNLLEVSIKFTDQLNPPKWWDKWIPVLGEFSREKFNKWKEIYYLGADPNVEEYAGPNIGKPLYWDNMPAYPNILSWYPSTTMFIRILRQYFIDNEVYPDGDTSKPRISVPYAY